MIAIIVCKIIFWIIMMFVENYAQEYRQDKSCEEYRKRYMNDYGIDPFAPKHYVDTSCLDKYNKYYKQ